MENKYYDDVLDAVDIRHVAEFYGVRFNSRGFALCPFHSEKTASFKVQSSKYAHCFGCGINVNAVRFVELMFRTDTKGALRMLNEDFGLGIPLGRKSTLKERRDAQLRLKKRTEDNEARRQAKEAWQAEYTRLYDLWCKYDKAINDFDGTLTDEYIKAIGNIDHIKYLIDIMPPEPA